MRSAKIWTVIAAPGIYNYAQLVRNLFLSTDRSVIRKAVEFSIVPLTEGILPKKRILELYLNIVEWGPGIYGAEAASRY
jgi:monofunctional biosynthetic peptidoglycan transglycosylase